MRKTFTSVALVLLVLGLALGGCGKRGITVEPVGGQAAIRERIAIDTASDCYLYNGADMRGYSDGHTTETYRLDAATGNLQLDGSITASTYISMTGWTFTDPSTISATLEVTDRVTAAGLTSSAVITGTTAAFSGAVSMASVTTGLEVLTASAVLTVTTAAFTPTASYQRIVSAGWVTPTIAVAAAGTRLTVVNAGSENITIADTGTTMLSAAAVLGAYDTLTLLSDGTNWLELSRSNN